MKDIPRSPDFLINLINYCKEALEGTLKNLFRTGPIHKELHSMKNHQGSHLFLGALGNLSPYKA